MDPSLVLMLVEKNGADIEAIVNKIGLSTLLSLAPHFMAIVNTLQGEQQKGAKR